MGFFFTRIMNEGKARGSTASSSIIKEDRGIEHTKLSKNATECSQTYHLIRPNRRLGLQFRAVAYLQGPRTSPREKIRNLLPRQIFLFLEID